MQTIIDDHLNEDARRAEAKKREYFLNFVSFITQQKIEVLLQKHRENK